MNRRLLRVVAIILPALLSACASQPQTEPAAASFLVVRHAEKGSDDPRDPALSATGTARAQRLAATLADVPLVAVYATAYRRTQQTARPSAEAHGLAVTTYDANASAADVAAQLRARHRQGAVLVVGHSNTVPAIAAALCGCTTTPLGDGDYGRVYRIDMAAGERARRLESTLP